MTDDEGSDREQWNINKSYADNIIVVNLKDLDYYEKVAMFGTANLPASFQIPVIMKTIARLEAIHRMLFDLKGIINNTIAFVRKKDREIFKKFYEELLKVEEEKSLEKCKKIVRKLHIEVVTINEKEFNLLLNRFMIIKREIITSLHKSGIIFNPSDEEDPAERKKRIMQEMIEGG